MFDASVQFSYRNIPHSPLSAQITFIAQIKQIANKFVLISKYDIMVSAYNTERMKTASVLISLLDCTENQAHFEEFSPIR